MATLGIAFLCFGVHGNTMTDSELDLLAINHLQGIALRVVSFRANRQAAPEYCCVFCAFGRPHDQFGLEYPSAVLVLFGLLLRIDKEQGDQAIAAFVLAADRALNTHFGMLLIGRSMRNGTFHKVQFDLPATGNALPDFDFDLFPFCIDDVAVSVFDLLVVRLGVVMVIFSDVLPPPGVDLNSVYVAVYTERESKAGWNEGLVAGGIDFVGCLRLGVDTTRRAVEFRAGFVATRMDIEIVRFLFVLGLQGTFQPLDTAVVRLARGELGNQITVPNAHIYDLLLRPVCRPEQIVHDRQLE